MRLIDADGVLEAEFTIEEGGSIGCVVDSEVIRRSPTIEAEPVVHARWKASDFIPGMLTCTNCGVQRNPKFKLGGGTWLYCPNCGAKMDLED